MQAVCQSLAGLCLRSHDKPRTIAGRVYESTYNWIFSVCWGCKKEMLSRRVMWVTNVFAISCLSRALTETGLATFFTRNARQETKEAETKLPADPESRRTKIQEG